MTLYIPDQFRMADTDEMHALMRAHPFATLVTHGPSGLFATHLPTVVKSEGAGLGTIECHFARANPHWKDIADPAFAATPVLMMFSGDQAYVRPGWYPSKAVHGKVVPTWNYAVVHATATAELIHDGAWLARHVAEITHQQEHDQSAPWATSDAPDTYIAALTRGLVGVRLTITRLEGKAKMSQNRETADALGAAAGLDARSAGTDQAVAAAIRKAIG
jgi:transcriptional regulator